MSKTPGQIAYEAFHAPVSDDDWQALVSDSGKERWESVANAVLEEAAKEAEASADRNFSDAMEFRAALGIAEDIRKLKQGEKS